MGPSNERDALGFAADTATNPLLYIAPYEFVVNNPLTWLGPYTYFTYAAMYNELVRYRGRICALQSGRNGSVFRDSVRLDVRAREPGGGFPSEGKTGRSLAGNPRIRLLHLQRP